MSSVAVGVQVSDEDETCALWQVKAPSDDGLAHRQFICSLDKLELMPSHRNDLQIILIDMTSKSLFSVDTQKQIVVHTWRQLACVSPGMLLH